MLSMIKTRWLQIPAAVLMASSLLALHAFAEIGAWPAEIVGPKKSGEATDSSETRCDKNNLVVNGSFECRSTGQPPNHIETLLPDNKDLAGWEIINFSPLPAGGGLLPGEDATNSDWATPWSIDWVGPTRWKASDRDHCLDLDGGIRQTIKTEPGKSYVLRFDLAANPELGPCTVHLRVLIDDDQRDFTFDSTGHDTGKLGWTAESIAFQAARPETTLTFYNSQPNAQSVGVALDHVVVSAPDPGHDRYRVTETSQGPILLDSQTGQSWRLGSQDGQSVWLPIPRKETVTPAEESLR